MGRTVHDLRNDIRRAVDRFERAESTSFTKESLAAIAGALIPDRDPGRITSKAAMRGEILQALDGSEAAEAVARPFRKAELQSIAAALEAD